MGPRPVLIATGAFSAFVVVVVLLLTVVNGNAMQQDYLIAGVTGTFASLIVVFGALVRAR